MKDYWLSIFKESLSGTFVVTQKGILTLVVTKKKEKWTTSFDSGSDSKKEPRVLTLVVTQKKKNEPRILTLVVTQKKKKNEPRVLTLVVTQNRKQKDASLTRKHLIVET